MSRAIAILLMFVMPGAALAACNLDVAAEAERQVESIGTWDELYAAFSRYRLCDDGAIAEGFSDALARVTLSRAWPEKIPNDNRFIEFILRHISSSIPADTLEQMRKGTLESCPAAYSDTCKRIVSEIDSLFELK